MIKIRINELEIQIKSNQTVENIKNKFKKNADIIILNGFTANISDILQNGDTLSLIKRGEIPSKMIWKD